jgi:hypothetical protein
MFQCVCGQIGRSLKAINGHPLGRGCNLDENGDFELVKSDLEEEPAMERRGAYVFAEPKLEKDEVFK